jgi:hypothetical protein
MKRASPFRRALTTHKAFLRSDDRCDMRRSGPTGAIVGVRRRRRVEERRRVSASEVHRRPCGLRRGDEAGGEVAVAGVVALGAGAVPLVEVKRVAERVVVELPPEVVVRPRRAVATEPPDEGLPLGPGDELRPLPDLEDRALPPALLLRSSRRRGRAETLVRGGGGCGPREAAASAALAREEGRLRFVCARG